jgi:hypothetical protein
MNGIIGHAFNTYCFTCPTRKFSLSQLGLCINDQLFNFVVIFFMIMSGARILLIVEK